MTPSFLFQNPKLPIRRSICFRFIYGAIFVLSFLFSLWFFAAPIKNPPNLPPSQNIFQNEPFLEPKSPIEEKPKEAPFLLHIEAPKRGTLSKDPLKRALKNKDYALALWLLKKQIHKYPHALSSYLLYARLQRQQGLYEEAGKTYHTLFKKQPNLVFLDEWATLPSPKARQQLLLFLTHLLSIPAQTIQERKNQTYFLIRKNRLLRKKHP